MIEQEFGTAPDRPAQPEIKVGADDVITIRWSTAITFVGAVLTAVLFFGAGIAFDRYVLAPVHAIASNSAPAPQQDVTLVTDSAPSFGPRDAAVTVVEFSDFQCPFCAQFKRDTFDLLRKTYGDRIRFVFRNFPLSSIHPDAQRAAEAAACADEQGHFWEYHDLLFANQRALDGDSLKQYAAGLGLDSASFAACLDSGKFADKIAADVSDGETNNVRGTPTFFINGKPLVGAQPFDAFQKLIDRQLAQ